MATGGDNLLAIDATDLEDLAGDLKAAERALGREQRRSHKLVADQVVIWSQATARSGTPQEQHFAEAIIGRATPIAARIGVSTTGDMAGANVPIFGAKRRFGWNAGWYEGELRTRRDLGGQLQSPRWVGSGWIAGRRGEGPNVINPTIDAHQTQIEDMHLDGYERALAKAFGGTR